MDIELARTFLKVVDEGNFINAAERLHLTQAAISRRIKALEEYLGCTLFMRNKAGAVLTPAGRRFLKHAANLVRGLERARQEVGVLPPYRASLAVGARFGLCEQLLLRWIPLMQTQAPEVALRAQIGFEEGLMQQLIDGTIDIGVMYTPQSRPGLKIELLLEEELILVVCERPDHWPSDAAYVHVDWGPEFNAQHSINFPEFGNPGLRVNIGWLGLQHILSKGGSGYFPERLVRSQLQAGKLHRVPNSPSFSLPAYVVYPIDRNEDWFGLAVGVMRRIALEMTLG